MVATAAPLLRAWQYARVRDFRRAFTVLDRLPADTARGPIPPWLATRIAVTRATVHLLRGEIDTAAATLDRVEEKGPVWSVARAAVALAAGDRPTAVDLLTTTLGDGVTETFTAPVDGWLLMALIHLDEGQPAAACEALKRALSWPASRGTAGRSSTQDRGCDPSCTPTRTSWQATTGSALPSPVAGPPQATAPARPAGQLSSSSHSPSENAPLLNRMAQAMSIEDIAADLFLSINTIKTHQKSIYRKLSVTRRNDAVRRARELQIT